MDNLTLSKKYDILLDQNKKTSTILNFFPYSKGQEHFKIFLIILAASFIEVIFPTFFVTLIISFIFCVNYYYLYHFRIDVSSYCIVEECYTNIEYKEMEIDVNFPNDPLYVTDEERELLLRDKIYSEEKKSIIEKIKNHYVFSTVMVLLYFSLYYVILSVVNASF
jgi:hypothetical protein